MWDISGPTPQVTITNNSTVSDAASLSWWFYITAPSGDVIYGADLNTLDSYPTPDVDGVAWTTRTFNLPTPFGNAPCGQIEFAPNVPYSVTVFVEDNAGSPPTLEYLTKTAIIVRPTGNIGWSGGRTGTCGNFGVARVSLSVNCGNQASAIQCADSTVLSYNNIPIPASTSNLWTMVYPQDPGTVPNKTASNTPNVNFPATVDSQAYTLYFNEYATYDYGGGVLVKVQYKLYNKQGSLGYTFAVNCNVNLCQLICQMRALRLLANQSCGKLEYPDLLNKITILNLLFTEILSSIMQPLCGNDVPGMIAEWKKIAKIDEGDCGCGQGYFGFGNPTGGNGQSGIAPIFVAISDLSTSPPGGCLSTFSPSEVFDPTGLISLGTAQTVPDMLALINANAAWQAYGTAFDSGSCLVGFFPLYAGITIPDVVIESSGEGISWRQGGNSFGATGVLGTKDNNPVQLIVDGTLRATLSGTGLAVVNDVSGATGTFAGDLQTSGKAKIVNAGNFVASINADALDANANYAIPKGGGTFQMRKEVIYSKLTGTALTGHVELFTTDAAASGRFVVTEILVVTKTITGSGADPIYNIGWTSSSYADLVSAGNVSDTINAPKEQTLVSGYLSVPASTTVYINVTTGTTHTAFDITVHVIGFYDGL